MNMQSIPRRLLDLVRRRSGAPEVQFTPPAVRGGNILYYWQWAHLQRAAGARASVLETLPMVPWLEEFPALRELTVAAEDVGLFDRRAFETRHHFGESFTAEQNRVFCQWLLNGSASFAERLISVQAELTPETCVVNVRRGDYYSVPEYRRDFAMDITSHVTQALTLLESEGRPVTDLLIVSDDPKWCLDKLAPFLPSTPRFLSLRRSMFDDLAALASARSLVLANSTFSYWGSHLARSRHEDHLAIAPAHHQRVEPGGWMDAMLDPRWPRTDAAGAE